MTTLVVPFTPRGAGPARPMVSVHLAGNPLGWKGLVDSGAENSIFPGAAAEDACIDLGSLRMRALAVGGVSLAVRLAMVHLSLSDDRGEPLLAWQAEARFAEAWSFDFALLGQSSFFRFFTITFRAADLEFELTPIVE